MHIWYIGKSFWGMLSGADWITAAINKQCKIRAVPRKSGFKLKKWTRSYPQVLENVPADYRENALPFGLDQDQSVKTLGIFWHLVADVFKFKICLEPLSDRLSKWVILSDIAKVFAGKLLKIVQESMKFTDGQIFAWTDSTIVPYSQHEIRVSTCRYGRNSIHFNGNVIGWLLNEPKTHLSHPILSSLHRQIAQVTLIAIRRRFWIFDVKNTN